MLLLLVGFIYIVLFGGLALLRREGLSVQFALEATVLTLLAAGLAYFTGFTIQPVLFLGLVYAITMRTRLLVDLGNFFAQRNRFVQADFFYSLAKRLWPDRTGCLIVQVNQGIASLQKGALDEAIATLDAVLEKANQGYLGIKYEAAAHYNLGVAYHRKAMEARAAQEFNAVVETWPASEYARRAQLALQQGRRKG